MSYSEEFDFSLALVKKCGESIKAAFSAEKRISEKSAANDLVTETDQEVEKTLIVDSRRGSQSPGDTEGEGQGSCHRLWTCQIF